MKTLSTLAIAVLAATSIATAADSFTLSSSTSLGTDKANCSGWVGSLSDSYLTSSVTLADEVVLTQISVATPNDNTSSPATTAKLSIMEYSAIGSAGDLVALSSNTATYNKNSTLTFTFDNVTLDSDKVYRFAFVSSDATETTYSPWQNVGASMRVAAVKITTDNSIGMTSQGNAGSWATHQYMPNATYTLSNVTTAQIPEPATATLSLLALAGLAARRRRK